MEMRLTLAEAYMVIRSLAAELVRTKAQCELFESENARLRRKSQGGCADGGAAADRLPG